MADLGYDGKVAVITGAGGGLGRSHALELAKRGALIVVNDLGGSVDGQGGSHTAAQQVVDEIKAAGGEAVANYDSVATPEGGKAIIQTGLDAFGKIDIVINNAGILRDAAFKNMDAEKLEPVIDVHLKGAFYVTLAAWGVMREQNYGRIVNTSSAAGIFGNFGQTNYGAAKAGLVGFTRVLAVEGAKNNIKANAIAPFGGSRLSHRDHGADVGLLAATAWTGSCPVHSGVPGTGTRHRPHTPIGPPSWATRTPPSTGNGRRRIHLVAGP